MNPPHRSPCKKKCVHRTPVRLDSMKTIPDFAKPARPIFIIGAPRSGTSITTWVVGQLPNVQTMPETSWIATLAGGAYLSYGYGASRGRYSHLSNVRYELHYFMQRIGEAVDTIVQDCFEERCRRLYGDYRATGHLQLSEEMAATRFHIRRDASDPKQRWIDGTPFNTFCIWALNEMFPHAQFIHNLRRPDGVATSLEGFDKFGHASVELEAGLQVWASHTRFAALGERALGKSRVFRLMFERIATEPEQLVRDLCAFLDEDYHPDCLIPLRQRINSSEVDHRRDDNLERLKDLPVYRECEALYDKALSQPPSESCDADALAKLKTRFVEYCDQHPLL